MAIGYTKLFNSILHSTIWGESNETRLIWITMLAMADRDGIVSASIPGLARAANISIQETETAIQCLLSPDPYSRTPDHEGRRIEPVDGGWFLFNHPKYREKMNQEERREYNRLKKQESREKAARLAKVIEREKLDDEKHKRGMSMTVNDISPLSALSAHSDTDTNSASSSIPPNDTPIPPLPSPKQSKGRGTQTELEAYCKEIGLKPEDGIYCFDKWEGNGWKNGGKAIKDWQATIRAWKRAGYLPPHANGNGNRPAKPDHRAEKAAREYAQPSEPIPFI